MIGVPEELRRGMAFSIWAVLPRREGELLPLSPRVSCLLRGLVPYPAEVQAGPGGLMKITVREAQSLCAKSSQPLSCQVLLHTKLNAAHRGPNGAHRLVLAEGTSEDLAVTRATLLRTGMPDRARA